MPIKRAIEAALADDIGLTYDDVRIRTRHATVMPSDVDINTKFSRNVPLKVPLVSAAMDTVTEHEMAIEMAKLGGIGVIHKNLSPEKQLREVTRVKYHLHGLIERPITVKPEYSVEHVLALREREGYTFHTFPVVDNDGKLVGILTRNDFDLCSDKSLRVGEIMTNDPITGDEGISIMDAYKRMVGEKKKILPLVDPFGKLAGIYVFRDVQRIVTRASDRYNLDKDGRLVVAAAVGVGKDAMERLEMLVAEKLDVAVIGTAHANSAPVIKTLLEARSKYPELDICVGNISEGDSIRTLVESGADGLLVGQGGGSICITRVIAGIGCPQVTAVYQCVRALEELGEAGRDVPVCADGGLRYSGDVTVAIAAGAHSVMMGGMLAGTKESPGEIVIKGGRPWKKYRGMGSMGAMQDNEGSRQRYSQEGTGKDSLVPEGVEGLVPYKGELGKLVYQYLGGLRSGMGYAGAADIEELREKAQFVRLTEAGKRESHPHDIVITEEPPNYQVKDERQW